MNPQTLERFSPRLPRLSLYKARPLLGLLMLLPLPLPFPLPPVGAALGFVLKVGSVVGRADGFADKVGEIVGVALGFVLKVGLVVGRADGFADKLGETVGMAEGRISGSAIGSSDISKALQSLSLNTQPFSALALNKLP